MEALFAETNAMVQRIHMGLADLERSSTAQEANEKADAVRQQLDAISNNCDQLETYHVSREPPHRRRDTKYRVDQLIYDHQHLVAALNSLSAKVSQRHRTQAQRDELMQRRFTSNESTSIQLDDAVHNDRLRRADRDLDDLIDHGQSVLGNLREQGMSLKDIKKKVLDVFNQLGLSNTVLRLIERRTTEDKIVLYTGMAVTSLIMFLIYYWLRW